MATAPTLPFVSVEEYLNNSYEPDMEYVDGALIERNVGKRKHSRIQGLILNLLMSNETNYQMIAYPEQRLQVAPTKFRIPDVCAMPDDHKREEVFTQPPLLVFEVVSSKDPFSLLVAKAKQYHALGVGNICIADPYNRTVFITDDKGRLNEAETLTVAFRIREGQSRLEFDFAQWFAQL